MLTFAADLLLGDPGVQGRHLIMHVSGGLHNPFLAHLVYRGLSFIDLPECGDDLGRRHGQLGR